MEKRDKCFLCEKNFTCTQGLKKHIEKCHTRPQDHKCEICDIILGNYTYLKKHYQLHEPTIHYECDICSKVFLRPEYLKKHMKVTHWEKQEERCNICNVCIKGRHNVKRHMKEVHNSGMSENCTFCDQRFSGLARSFKWYAPEKS